MFEIKTDDKNNRMNVYIDHDIDNRIEDVVEIIRVQRRFLSSNYKSLFLNFTDCKNIDAAISVIIGALPVYARKYKRVVKYCFPEKDKSVLSFMQKVGMYKFYMKNEIGYTGDNVIPFDCIVNEDMMDKYTDKIMTMAPIRMQKEAQDILSSYIYEIFQNGLFHSQSPVNVFTSGCWMPDKKEFRFSIYDMGIGIPQKIRDFMEWQTLTSDKCLKLAFLDGYSTSSNKRVNRGLGLTRLKSFIKLNNGSMTMYTGDVCYVIEGNRNEYYAELNPPIMGTLIIISIIADEDNIYIVEKEKKNDDY